jgi:hypothetical protein
VNKAITLLGLTYGPLVNPQHYHYWGGGRREQFHLRFEIYKQHEDISRGNNNNCLELLLVKCSAEDIILDVDSMGVSGGGEMKKVMLSKPLSIQPNVPHIILVRNPGNSTVQFVSNRTACTKTVVIQSVLFYVLSCSLGWT